MRPVVLTPPLTRRFVEDNPAFAGDVDWVLCGGRVVLVLTPRGSAALAGWLVEQRLVEWPPRPGVLGQLWGWLTSRRRVRSAT